MDLTAFGRVEQAGPGDEPIRFDAAFDLDPAVFDDEMDFDRAGMEKNPEVEDDANRLCPMEECIVHPAGPGGMAAEDDVYPGDSGVLDAVDKDDDGIERLF